MTNGKFQKLKGISLRFKFLIIKKYVFEGIDSGINDSCVAIEKIIKSGAKVEYKTISEIDTAFEISKTVFPAEAYGMWQHGIEKTPEKMFAPIRERFRSGKRILAHDYVFSLQRLIELRISFLEKVIAYDAILVPTSPIKPPSIAKLLDDHEFFTESNLLALRNTRIANSLNLCALTMPTETDFSGLMFMRGPNTEFDLMSIGLAIEKIK